MIDIRLVRVRQFLHLDHNGTFDLNGSRDVLAKMLRDAQQEDRNLLLDVRDSNVDLSMRDVWALVQHLHEYTPEFDKKMAILDRWDETYDRMQFFEASAGELGFQARAFIDFEKAMDWLWEKKPVPISQ